MECSKKSARSQKSRKSAPRSISFIANSIRSAKSVKTRRSDNEQSEAQDTKTAKTSANASKDVEKGTESCKNEGETKNFTNIPETPAQRRIRICCFVFSLLILVIPIGMIVAGSFYYSSCPLEPKIPLWFIIGGALYIANSLIDIYEYCQKDTGKCSICLSILQSLLMVIMFIWLIVGSVWIYTVHSDVTYDPRNKDYFCTQPLYLTAFIASILGNICVGLICLIFFIFGIFVIRVVV